EKQGDESCTFHGVPAVGWYACSSLHAVSFTVLSRTGIVGRVRQNRAGLNKSATSASRGEVTTSATRCTMHLRPPRILGGVSALFGETCGGQCDRITQRHATRT